jgi:uncharacterized membrane protein YgaE (UPF0421/DUF939 family)
MAESKSAQTIEQLRERYQKLNDAKVAANANYQTAHEALEQLKAAARAEHGTDDLEQLKAKLAQMQADNDRKRAEYQAHLERIEGDLREVEKKFSVAQGQK